MGYFDVALVEAHPQPALGESVATTRWLSSKGDFISLDNPTLRYANLTECPGISHWYWFQMGVVQLCVCVCVS